MIPVRHIISPRRARKTHLSFFCFQFNKMANPQTENGFMQLATELVDIMAQIHLNGNEHQLIYAVWRKTYCWKKKEDWISLSQLEELTGLSRVAVCRAQKSLVSKKILLKKDGKLSFNKLYTGWVVSKTTLVSKTAIGSVKTVLGGSVKNDTHNRYYTKDNIQKGFIQKSDKFDEYLSECNKAKS